MLILTGYAAVMGQPSIRQPYEIIEYTDNPGIFYEKIGHLHYSTRKWKLIIKLDIATITRRHKQIEDYLEKTEKACNTTQLHKETCDKFDAIAKRDSIYLHRVITQLNAIYKPQINRRRGLIDGIGTLSKTLFGVMDANDEKHINTQLNALDAQQKITQHEIHKQIKIINETVAHLEDIENIIDRNDRLLQQRITEFMGRTEIVEHFLTIITIMAELRRDIENIADYLTLIQKGVLDQKLIPVNNIIDHLKEISHQLPIGTYFPFKLNADNWIEIEKSTEITAYFDKTNIFTILNVPVIEQSAFELLSVLSFPTPS